MTGAEGGAPGARPAVVDRLFAGLSMLGGLSLLGLGLLVTASVLSRWFGFGGISGDFEMVQMLTAVGIFAFLPLCQIKRGHIFVDTFTGRLPARWRAGLDGLWDLLAALAFGFIAWRMLLGASEAFASGTVTMVLSFPVGWAILACALVSGLACAAALIAARRMLAR